MRARRLIYLLASAVLALVALPGHAAPPSQPGDPIVVTLESPAAGQTVAGEVEVRGWAIDTRAVEGTGIRTSLGGVQVWMDRRAGSATGQLLGDATYGESRPDVAGQRGPRFEPVGFRLTWNTCLVPAGPHSLQVFAESAAGSGVEFGLTQVDVVVGGCPAAARPPEVIGSQPLRSDPRWQAILQRAGELRGLAPRADVLRAPLTRESYDRRFEAEFARYYQSQDIDTSRLLLISFGLLDPGYSLASALQTFYTVLPLGIYDTDASVLFVSRDPPDSPLARVTMAHEITHALQDQHYGLQVLVPSPAAVAAGEQAALPPDASMAVRALVEGDAVLVQRMYQATTVQDPAELALLEREEAEVGGAVDFASLPYVVVQSTYFPYVHGPLFIHGVLGDGPLTTYGEYGPAVDALFRRPPISTAQILHPERYRDGVAPVPVALPDAGGMLGGDWLLLGDSVLGEFNHRLLLDHFLRGVEPARAAAASGGWAGDRASVYRRLDDSGAPLGDVAVLLHTRWLSPADATAWAEAFAASVALRYADPVRYAGRTDQLVTSDLGPGTRAWEMPGERAIVLRWSGAGSVIAVAPSLDLATGLAALPGP